MNLTEISERISAFRDARDWQKFHSPKEMILSLMIEVSELAELFRFKSEDEVRALIDKQDESLRDELADILYWVVLLARDMNVSLEEAFLKKMEKNEARYPVELARGNSKKYTDLK